MAVLEANRVADSGGATLTVPPGTLIFHCANTAPSGFIKANGAAINRNTFAALFTAIGTTFGAGDGSTTFRIPDMRGEFPRAWDDSRGVDSGRLFGSFQDATATRQMMNDWSDSDASGELFFVGQAFASEDAFGTSIPSGAKIGQGSNFSNLMNDNSNRSEHTNSSGQTGTWIRYRPRNKALLACIKF